MVISILIFLFLVMISLYLFLNINVIDEITVNVIRNWIEIWFDLVIREISREDFNIGKITHCLSAQIFICQRSLYQFKLIEHIFHSFSKFVWKFINFENCFVETFLTICHKTHLSIWNFSVTPSTLAHSPESKIFNQKRPSWNWLTCFAVV